MVDIILSVKPEYAEKILNGSKRFEFRKQIPRRRINQVYIYASHPEKKIVGRFRIRRVISGSPNEIWEKCGNEGGIEKDKFFSYFANRAIGYGFEVEDVERFDHPIDPVEINCDFRAPQSFAYALDTGGLDIKYFTGSLSCYSSEWTG